MENRIDTVVWDADNTLWDWISMHLQGMRAMSQKIAQITDVPEEEVKESMKRVYASKHTFDYKGLVQHMDVVEDWAARITDNRKKLKEILDMGFAVHAAYTNSKHDTFEMYPDVPEVLRDLQGAGVRNVILSDAPMPKIIRRLNYFEIDDCFELILGRPEDEANKGKVLPHYEGELEAGGAYDIDAETIEISNPCMVKPYTDLAEYLGKTPDEVARTVAMVGDNFGKDMGTAFRNNCYGVFAHYGATDQHSVTGLYEYGGPTVVHRNASLIDLTKGYREMIQMMGHKLVVADSLDDVRQFVLD